MPFRTYLDILIRVVWPIIASVGVVSIPLAIVYRIVQRKENGQPVILIVVFGLLGGVCGICIGSSREPVIGTVFPAFLTLITALSGYVFTREGMAKIRPIIPYCLIALLLVSIYWVFVGAQFRSEYEAYSVRLWQNLMRFERVDLEVEKAQRFKLAGLELSTEIAKPSPSLKPLKEPELPKMSLPTPSE